MAYAQIQSNDFLPPRKKNSRRLRRRRRRHGITSMTETNTFFLKEGEKIFVCARYKKIIIKYLNELRLTREREWVSEWVSEREKKYMIHQLIKIQYLWMWNEFFFFFANAVNENFLSLSLIFEKMRSGRRGRRN